MTTAALRSISWTARVTAVLFLLSVTVVILASFVEGFSYGAYVDPSAVLVALFVLLLLGIGVVPSRVLFRHRGFTRTALVLSLVPPLCLGCLIIGFLRYSSPGYWRSPENLPLVALFSITAIGVCSLPVALVTADALAQRGGPVEVLSRKMRICLLLVGGLTLITIVWLLRSP